MERPAGFGPQYASAFQEPSVADAYAFRPAYPPAVFDVLTHLLPATPQRLLDVGCGTGALTRQLTRLALPIDAIDISPVMIARGKRLPNGTNPLIHWVVGAIETAPVTPPYDLITAGESLQWIFRQSVDAYIESFHGRASFARERMDARDARAFDQQLQELVTAHTQALVELPLIARIVWGRPLLP